MCAPQIRDVSNGFILTRRAIHQSFARASATNEEDKHTKGSRAVGSVVVTLEAGEKLVIGAFISTAADGEWEYWEGEFGASELEEHVRALLHS